MSVQILGSNSLPINGDSATGGAIVALKDPSGNSALVLRNTFSTAPKYGIPIAGVNDGAFRLMRLDRQGSIRPGFDTLMFHDDIEGTTINTQLWTSTVTTFTQAQLSTTGIDLNSGAGLAANSASLLISQRQFSKMQLSPLKFKARIRIIPASNSIQEFGFGIPSGVVSQIPTGCFWRYTSGGTVIPVISYNGSDIATGVDAMPALTTAGGSANYYAWGVVVEDDSVLFTCQNSATGEMVNEQTLAIPMTQPKIWSATHLPIFFRNYVTASPAASAPRMYMSDTMVVGLDIVSNKPWAHQQAALGSGAEVHPTTFAQTSTWANSAAAANATLSNTAAGYATLGGLFNFIAVAGAATDYALFVFTVPAPYSFYCTGIHISSYNNGAAVATTPTILQWGIANNSSALSLAGTINRTAIGMQSFAIGAPVGQTATDIDMPFEVPLRTDGGRFLQVILRMPVATATASQVISGNVTLRGYFE